MPASLPLVDSPLRAAERALRKPSSAVWLQSVRVRTTRFDEALAFYGSLLGLSLRTVRVHPVSAQLSAQMTDAEGHDVLEIVEQAAEADAPGKGGHELAFGMPRRTWHLLRARLDTKKWPYEEAGDCLYLSDADGMSLRIESLGDLSPLGSA
ncbi:MAG: VOC family protein [Bacteroidota bacterium]